MAFVWKIYVGKTSIEILEYIKKMLEEEGTQVSQFQRRIIFMSMYNDDITFVENNQNESVCRDNAKRVAEFAENF